MKQTTAWHRLDVFARSLSPVVVTLFLVLVGLVPLRIPEFSPVLPWLAMIAVYYWSVHRPDLMPLWAIFLIGLFQDLLGGGPVGVGVFALFAVNWIVAGQRRFFSSASFLMIWLAFLPVCGIGAAVIWFLSSVVLGLLLDPRPIAFQFLVTVGVYPCLAWLFGQMQRAFLR